MKKIIFMLLLLSSIFLSAEEDYYAQLNKLIISGASEAKLLQWCINSKALLNFKDLVKLAQSGINELVIDCLLKNAAEAPEITGILKYENGSFWVGENIRCYFRKYDGKMTLVITNLDEKGKRIGGEVPYEEQIAERKYWEEKRKSELTESIPQRLTQQNIIPEVPKQAVVEYVSVPTYSIPYSPFIYYSPLYPYLSFTKAHNFYNNCLNCNFINDSPDNLLPTRNKSGEIRNFKGPSAFPMGISSTYNKK